MRNEKSVVFRFATDDVLVIFITAGPMAEFNICFNKNASDNLYISLQFIETLKSPVK